MAGYKDWFLYSTDLDTTSNPKKYGVLRDLSNTKLANPSASIIPAALTHDPLPRDVQPRYIVVEGTNSKYRRKITILNLTDFSNPAITGKGVTFTYPTVGDEEVAGSETYVVVDRVPERIKRGVSLVKHTIVTTETDSTNTPA